MSGDLAPLRRFVREIATLLDRQPSEPEILREAGRLLGELVREDTWLPDAFAKPCPERYQQYLLHRDPRARFSLVSFVWGPGQSTPVHDHTVWGLVGMLRGAEISQAYRAAPDGLSPEGAPVRLQPGDVEAVSPSVGDIHRVANAHDDRTSISIHLYGAYIGEVRRHVYAPDGALKPFVSGYSPAPSLELLSPAT
jgi:predicted metal-dependent enzyme (double-stranded beta helix superfamily)